MVYEISYEIIFFFFSFNLLYTLLGTFSQFSVCYCFPNMVRKKYLLVPMNIVWDVSTIKKKSGFEFDFWKIFLFVMGIVGMMKELGNTLLFILHCAGNIYIYIYIYFVGLLFGFEIWNFWWVENRRLANGDGCLTVWSFDGFERVWMWILDWWLWGCAWWKCLNRFYKTLKLLILISLIFLYFFCF